MSTFIQVHMLTSYPPSNLNRDDLGRPKSAMLGAAPRLRVSSQSLKRAWRTSETFVQALQGNIGTRTKLLGRTLVLEPLVAAGFKEDDAIAIATQIAGVFGKNQGGKKVAENAVDIEQLAHLAPEELEAVEALVKTLTEEKREPSKEELTFLKHRPSAVDIALFGRMLAAKPEFNVEAACQVGHAITVHRAKAEDDYFTAVDDLKGDADDRGAAHVGEMEFGAGVYYLYLCINETLLVENLRGDKALAARAVKALIETAATVAPRGKQNSFASRSRASYIRVERGDEQPRNLAMAFVKPVGGEDMIREAMETLRSEAERFAQVYESKLKSAELNALTGEGRLSALQAFATGEEA